LILGIGVARTRERTRMTEVVTYLIDADRLAREGLRELLADSRYRIAVDAGSTAELAVRIDESVQPHVVLVDCGANPDAARRDLALLRATFPLAKIAVLAGTRDPDLLLACHDAPVNGCLLKEVSTDALIATLDLIRLGERVFPSLLIDALREGASVPRGAGAGDPELPPAGSDLSPREFDILRCLAAGCSNKEIANRLEVSEATVKVHLKSILRKIDVQNRTQAAIWALHHGVQPDAAPEEPEPRSPE
jgi:two-component system nitrate/nitrite response regulator NarL